MDEKNLMDAEEPLPVDATIITQAVKAIFNIRSMTLGGGRQGYRVRYDGELTVQNSEVAYDQLSEVLKPMKLMPLFRQEKNDQVILIMDQLPKGKPGPIWVNILLFALTLLSVMFTG
ncbi:MAG: hypothetical protein ACK2TV_16075, partial [Anaerolineales bacterium]